MIWPPGLPIVLVSLLFLGACTGTQKAAIQGGIDKIKKGNDTTASTLIQSTCGITIGAFNRLENLNYRRGVDLLCGGDGEDPITLKDLNLILSVKPAE